MTSELAYKTRRLMERGIKKCEICGNERELLESNVSKKIICKNCLVDTVFNFLEGIESRKRKYGK